MAYPNGKEQKKAFERLCESITPSLALYCLCAVYDVPFDADIEADSWGEYLGELESKPHPIDFSIGETDVNAAILGGMEEAERWATVWGEGDEDHPYTENDYKRLDELYKTMTAQLDSAGGIVDRQQEDTARTCARMALQRDKLILSRNKDDVVTAKNFDEMIRKNLADANMRKADILPSAMQRPDGFVDALKKKYGLTMDMTKDDVMGVFFKWCHSHKYPQTVDAEEHALLAILRTMQKNDDLPEPFDLPDDMRLSNFAEEFADSPNDFENEVYDYLHLVRDNFAPLNGEDDD